MLGVIADAVAWFGASFSRFGGCGLCGPWLRCVLRVAVACAGGCCGARIDLACVWCVWGGGVPGFAVFGAAWVGLLRWPSRSFRSRSVMLGAIADAVARFGASFSRFVGCRLCRPRLRSVLRVAVTRVGGRCDVRIGLACFRCFCSIGVPGFAVFRAVWFCVLR